MGKIKERGWIAALVLLLAMGVILIYTALTPQPFKRYEIILPGGETIEVEYKWCETDGPLVKCYGDSNELEYSVETRGLKLIR